jgi:Subtilisin inhibitor-like
MRPKSVCATALSAGVIVLCGMLAPAAASEQPSQSTLVITAWDSSGFIAEQIHEVVLKCEPAGGSHVDAATACTTLDDVDGEFDALEPTGEACILIYKPVYIEVGGNWRDHVIHFQHNYSNLCLAKVESAGVFSF